MGEQEEMGKEKKETSEAIISGRVVAVSLGVCLCVFFSPFFPIISDSLDEADSQLRPITVY